VAQSVNSAWASGRNNFDFLRLALAVLVIYSHCFPLGTGVETSEPFRVLTHGQMTGGAVAVDLFFVMSGFLITASAERSRGWGSFLRKRVARIYPAFVVSAVVTLAVVAPLSGAVVLGSTRWMKAVDIVLQTLRLREFDYSHAFLGNPYPGAINGSVWSIQYEFWCYIGVLLLLSTGLLRRRDVLLACFVAAVGVSVLFQVQGYVLGGKLAGRVLGSPQLWARLLPLYMAGVVFYLYRERVRLVWWGAAAAVIALLFASWVSFGWTAVFPVAGTYLVMYVGFAPWLRLERFGRFGDFSYGTYLYAFPIEQLLMQHFGHRMRPMALFACAAPLTVAVAVVSWYAVERRLLRPARRRESVAEVVEKQERAASINA